MGESTNGDTHAPDEQGQPSPPPAPPDDDDFFDDEKPIDEKSRNAGGDIGEGAD